MNRGRTPPSVEHESRRSGRRASWNIERGRRSAARCRTVAVLRRGRRVTLLGRKERGRWFALPDGFATPMFPQLGDHLVRVEGARRSRGESPRSLSRRAAVSPGAPRPATSWPSGGRRRAAPRHRPDAIEVFSPTAPDRVCCRRFLPARSAARSRAVSPEGGSPSRRVNGLVWAPASDG